MPSPQEQLAQLVAFVQADSNATQSSMREMRRLLYRHEAIQRLEEVGRTPKLPVRFTSQFGEDVALWDLLEGKLEGFYIEVGAYDGTSLSVTYPFEAVGWTGLLIEAIPERYEQCVKNRPNSRVVHAALSKRGATGTTEFHVVQGNEGQGMYSYLTTNAVHEQVNLPGQTSKPVTVPVTTMDDLLASHKGPIDFAVIDVEGGELELLDGFDLRRFKPRVLVIEDNSRGHDADLTNYMNAQPYQPIGLLAVNRVYVHRDETAILRRCQAHS